jgi:hypothetical protein
MPLRDHFKPPVIDEIQWQSIHYAWPMAIVLQLKAKLPPGFIARPSVKIGTSYEIDVATFDSTGNLPDYESREGEGGTAVLTDGSPTLLLETHLPEEDEYEVNIYDAKRDMKLVAAIEIVSPRNKDRFQSRAAFVEKCAALLRREVCVSIIDVVTDHSRNLYAELMTQLGYPDPAMAKQPSIYAVTCYWWHQFERAKLHAWAYPLEVGKALPSLPIILTPQQSVTLSLEETYEKTCEDLQVA